MNADDMRAVQNACCDGGCGAICSLVFGYASESAADEAFARWAYEDGEAEAREFRKAGDQLVVLGEAFAEADAWIENQLGFWDSVASRQCGGFFFGSG